MANKYVIYLDGVSRGIVLTDHDNASIDELTKKMSSAMASNNVCELRTKTDTLLVRPNQINAVHIQGGPRVGSAKPKVELEVDLEEEQSLVDIVPELDLGDDLDDVIEDVSEEYIDDDLPEDEPDDSEEDPIIDDELTDKDELDVISEVAAWHSEIDNKKDKK